MKYPPKDESEESGDPDSSDSSKQVKRARSGNSEQVICVRSRDPVPLPVWLSPSEHSEIVRRLYSETIYSIRGETIYNRRVMLEGVRKDLKTGHKAVTIRGLSMAEIIGQIPKDKIDEVLAGDLEDRCIIQKTRMTRHMTRLLQYVHSYEQLSNIMVKKPIEFLQSETRKHDHTKNHEQFHTQKDQKKILTQRGKKEMVNVVVKLMKGMQLVKTENRQAPGTELLLTLMSSPVLQKSLSVTGVKDCNHISCVIPDRVFVRDKNNIIITDTATGKQLHNVKNPLHSGTGIHTVNCDSELIYIDKDKNINKLSSDMKTTATLIKHTDKTWEPQCVYFSPVSGDLLVGMWRDDTSTVTGKVMRYDNTGKHKQTIPHNDYTPHDLYEDPWYITENNNGDVLVSDWRRRAVVVTSVQMLDRDGQFLSYLLTRQSPGIHDTPWSLSYDVTNHVLCVGSWNNNTFSVFRYINRHLALSDTRENCDVSLSSDPFNSQHIPGLTQEQFDREREEEEQRRREERERIWEEYMSDLRTEEEEEEEEEDDDDDEEDEEEEEEEEDHPWYWKCNIQSSSPYLQFINDTWPSHPTRPQ
uniref:Uncharacterized protein LOC111132783 n=1 Tax=Crassostrea virginica TaxID=6565 RepID=A0A8B8E9G5_CRAVI|nr:uncharacterized protein LOC111132783 [Crassostrea virginica]